MLGHNWVQFFWQLGLVLIFFLEIQSSYPVCDDLFREIETLNQKGDEDILKRCEQINLFCY